MGEMDDLRAQFRESMKKSRQQARDNLPSAIKIADIPGFPGSVTENQRRIVVEFAKMVAHHHAIFAGKKSIRHVALLGMATPDERRVLEAAEQVRAYRRERRSGTGMLERLERMSARSEAQLAHLERGRAGEKRPPTE